MKKKKKEDRKENVDEILSDSEMPGGLEGIKNVKELAGIGVPIAVDQILNPPKVLLVQPTSREMVDSNGKKANPGQFFSSAKGKIFDEIKVVILGFCLGRTLYQEVEGRATVACQSRDSIKGNDFKSCSSCENNQWKESIAPPCKQYFEFLVLDEDGDPFVLTARGTSFGPARLFVNDCLGASLPLFAYNTLLTSKLIEGKKGKFYTMRFERKEKHDLKSMKDYAAMSLQTFGYHRPFAYLTAKG